MALPSGVTFKSESLRLSYGRARLKIAVATSFIRSIPFFLRKSTFVSCLSTQARKIDIQNAANWALIYGP